jgi:hypothetical protein
MFINFFAIIDVKIDITCDCFIVFVICTKILNTIILFKLFPIEVGIDIMLLTV